MVRTRRALREDVPVVEEIAWEAHEVYVGRLGGPPVAMVLDYGERVDTGTLSVVEDAAGICGFVVCSVAGKVAFLESIAVALRARGRGHGRRLLAHAEATARSSGCVAIETWTFEALIEFRIFCGRYGYEERDRPSEIAPPRICLVKALR